MLKLTLGCYSKRAYIMGGHEKKSLGVIPSSSECIQGDFKDGLGFSLVKALLLQQQKPLDAVVNSYQASS